MITALKDHPEFVTYLERINRLYELQQRDFHEEKITGASKTVDVVVDIFNRVNSGGTMLSKGDLALAKNCAKWPKARGVRRGHLAKWDKAGYDRFSLDWLLRNVNTVATGRALFTTLDKVPASDFETALADAAKYVSPLPGHLRGPPRARPRARSHGALRRSRRLPVPLAQRDRMLFWYVHAGLRGRFTGSTETVLAQNFETLEKSGNDATGDQRINDLTRWRGGNLNIGTYDFDGLSRGSRFYPLLYMLTRVHGARDLEESDDPRAGQVVALVKELMGLGCSEPLLGTEIPEPGTGRVLTVAEVYWPEGLQPGQGEPVVLELDPDQADISRMKELGYEVFTSGEALLGLVQRRFASLFSEEELSTARDRLERFGFNA